MRLINKLKHTLNERFLVFDGAMGTSLKNMELSMTDFPSGLRINELLNIHHPNIVKEIHCNYIKAGADIIETNTFSANGISLKHHGMSDKIYDINREAVRIARDAGGSFDHCVYIAGSIGPGDKLPTMGDMDYDSISGSYTAQIDALLKEKVDILLLETFQDPLAIKACLWAVDRMMKKHCHYPPVMVSVTFSLNGQMLLGTSPRAIIQILSPFPLFSLGINCSLGPEGLKMPISLFSRYFENYISFMPNAGLPQKTDDGLLHYDMDADKFSDIMAEYAEEHGIDILGGCCGTTYNYICSLKQKLSVKKKKEREILSCHGIASLFKNFDYEQTPAPFIIGERTNVTGSRKFAGIVKKGDLNSIISFCKDYSESGMHAIDLFIKTSEEICEGFILNIIRKLGTSLNAGLCADSKDLTMIVRMLKVYPGKMIINSASLKDGEKELCRYFRTVRQFGCSLILLAMDEKKMAVQKEDKIHVFERMLRIAKQEGIKTSQIIFDPMVFSVVAGDPDHKDSVLQCFGAMKEMKKKYSDIPFIMGVSNISYGVKPSLRKIINSIFLSEAVLSGLDIAIINKADILPIDRIDSDMLDLVKNLIYNKDNKADEWLNDLLSRSYDLGKNTGKDLSPSERLHESIIRGRSDTLEKDIVCLIDEGIGPENIINDILLKSIGEVGRSFKEGMMPLPFVLDSAEAMRRAFDILGAHLKSHGNVKDKKFILATVRGDIHDIGKNLVDIIVSSHGYEVINLGIEVDINTILDKAGQNKNCCIGLSGLINESLDKMEEYIKILRENKINVPVILGGAAVSQDFVSKRLGGKYNNIYYGKDPFDAVKFLNGEMPYNDLIIQHKHREKKRRINRLFVGIDSGFINTVRTLRPFLSDILPNINKDRLIKVRWKYHTNKGKFYDYKAISDYLASSLQNLQKEGMIGPVANYSYTKVRRVNDSLIILKSGEKIKFERNGFSFIDYFEEKRDDIIVLFFLTLGKGAKCYKDLFYEEGRYKEYHLVNGLLNEIVEAFLKYLFDHINKELGLNELRSVKPLRLAYGYPYCPGLREQKGPAELLKINNIEIYLTEIFQLSPEESSSGFILPFVTDPFIM